MSCWGLYRDDESFQARARVADEQVEHSTTSAIYFVFCRASSSKVNQSFFKNDSKGTATTRPSEMDVAPLEALELLELGTPRTK